MTALWLGTWVGLTTGLGGLVAVGAGQPGRRPTALLLGLAAGVMLFVTFLHLWPASFAGGGWTAVLAGTGAGLLVLAWLDYWIGHRIARSRDTNMALLFLLGIALHNLPEGMAVGAGHDSSHGLGLLIALALAAHNVPEGIGAGLLLIRAGSRRTTVLLATFLVGLVTPVGTWLSLTALGHLPSLLGGFLALAAGAMLYVGGFRLLPESLAQDRLGTLAGIALSWLVLRLFAG